ncbi:histone-lysine N-methyltransferase, H3 lysine-79 specific-like [Anthonomus grandis grandis]|uniref:histone-lysine N-methyltransferase, H3 lysine-79 specific-like n=1 Tax=Anthonomus grandis grandis TaxID=2921223 RepID=UPI0021656261|nr:histone-lysine N-methyltransferase, H3 lysine-79 specific-like [Anthonomus grandis grandis]
MELIKYKDNCRVCLKSRQTLKNIFTHILEGYEDAVDKIIFSLFSIKLNTHGAIPQLICRKCLIEIENILLFKESLIQSEKILSDALNCSSRNTEKDTGVNNSEAILIRTVNNNNSNGVQDNDVPSNNNNCTVQGMKIEVEDLVYENAQSTTATRNSIPKESFLQNFNLIARQDATEFKKQLNALKMIHKKDCKSLSIKGALKKPVRSNQCARAKMKSATLTRSESFQSRYGRRNVLDNLNLLVNDSDPLMKGCEYKNDNAQSVMVNPNLVDKNVQKTLSVSLQRFSSPKSISFSPKRKINLSFNEANTIKEKKSAKKIINKTQQSKNLRCRVKEALAKGKNNVKSSKATSKEGLVNVVKGNLDVKVDTTKKVDMVTKKSSPQTKNPKLNGKVVYSSKKNVKASAKKGTEKCPKKGRSKIDPPKKLLINGDKGSTAKSVKESFPSPKAEKDQTGAKKKKEHLSKEQRSSTSADNKSAAFESKPKLLNLIRKDFIKNKPGNKEKRRIVRKRTAFIEKQENSTKRSVSKEPRVIEKREFTEHLQGPSKRKHNKEIFSIRDFYTINELSLLDGMEIVQEHQPAKKRALDESPSEELENFHLELSEGSDSESLKASKVDFNCSCTLCTW